jgi:hypothetical protein
VDGSAAVIPNVTRGGNTRGLLLYLVGVGKREEHENPHLVAGSPEAIWLAGQRSLEGADAAALARFLDEPREAFGTTVTIAERDASGQMVGSRDAHVWHCSLSLHPDEPALSDARWGELGEEFVAAMGFAGEAARAQHRWVAVRHGRSTGGSDHAHLVVGLIAEDRSKARLRNDWPRAQAASRELEARFGLRRLEAGQRGTGSRGIKPGERMADTRHRRRDHGSRGEHPERGSRHTLERVVRACATASHDEGEFIRALRDQGVRVRPRYAEGGRDAVVGYSVRLPGGDEGPGRTVWYGGGKLARDLTLPALRRGWSQDAGERERTVGEWSSSRGPRRSVLERRAELEQRGLLWHRCTTEIERVRQGLRAAGGDPVACAHAAREGAGVLAAWSIDLEGEQPGALARASRQLARSAELPGAAPPASPRTVSRASGLALFMLAAGRPDSAAGWLLVCRELGLLAGEIGRVHRARGELERAHEIESDVQRELEQIRVRIDTDRVPAVLDAETEAARRARDPLGPPTRTTREHPAEGDDVEAVKRLSDPTRRRRPRQR